MQPTDPVTQALLELAKDRAEEWKNLFFWGVGGMASGYALLLVYLKGVIGELTVAKAEAARGDLAQAQSNTAVASALEKLAEAVNRDRG